MKGTFDIGMVTDIAKIAGKNMKGAQEPAARLDGMKVLLVEDSPLNMEIAKFILEDEGIEVTTAENGQIAVNIFNNSLEGAFDAVLMDVRMPVMDGLAAARAIRALPRMDAAAVPIVAMTADAYDEDIKRTAEAGMNAHLIKPVSQDELLQALRRFYSV